MGVKGRKRVQATLNSQQANRFVYDYKGVDGRVYNSESGDVRPLPIRSEKMVQMRHNEQLSITLLFRIETYLEELRTYPVLDNLAFGKARSKAKRERITQKQRAELNSRYRLEEMGEDEIFRVVCERYPEAIRYQRIGALVYAVRYGEAIIETVNA